jgi:PAS domain S-box-containing protein
MGTSTNTSEMTAPTNGFFNFFNTLSDKEQKNQEEQNTRAELDSYLKIMDKSALVSVSDLRGNIIHANQLFCDVSKYTVQELVNKPHNIVRHPDTPAYTFKKLWETISSGKVWQGELKNMAKDGSEYWVFATVAPVMDQHGKPVNYISVRYDITNHKQMEERLKSIRTRPDFELLENIEYAKSIHNAFLNNDTRNSGMDSFLIYQAQKIISGDFYKTEQNNNKTMVVIGDSAGHGISASYISVLILNIITRVMESCKNDPCKLLKKTNTELNRITHYNNKTSLDKQSADLIVCCIDKELMKLTYASAKIKGILIRDRDVIFLEKEHYAIGEMAQKDFKISNKTIDLKKGDCLYIISDGVIDQFGGPDDKKIGLKTIVALLKEIQTCRMPLQRTIIEKMLHTWQGEKEQTDDITFFGIKI